MSRKSEAGKRICVFNKELQDEFPFLRKAKTNSSIHCNTCNGEFSIASAGRNAITRHTESDKHKQALLAAASSSKVNIFFRKAEFGIKEKELAIAEATYVFHTIAHNQTFRSLDCTSKLIRTFFEPKFTCARTKAEAIVRNVLAPSSVHEMLRALQDVNFLTVFTDASNHKDIKLFPIVIRYFDQIEGIQLKLLDCVSLPGETSEIVATAVSDTLEKYKLEAKVAAFCADNAPINFGGLQRRGTNNVFSKLKDSVNKPIIGVGCNAHIVHNTMQTAADLLPIDIESVVIKLYGHFHVYTVRVELLKDFCREADVEYMRVLGYSKTRWLALMPAIERILKLFAPLKSFFLSAENCPRILRTFFEDDSAEMWLYFIHDQAAVFDGTIKRIEGDKISLSEVMREIKSLEVKLVERSEIMYLPQSVRNQLEILEQDGWPKMKEFKRSVTNFYKHCTEYLRKRVEQMDKIDCFQWICLYSLIEWADVIKSSDFIYNFEKTSDLLEKDKNERELLDEFALLKKYINADKIQQWKENDVTVSERWVDVFKHLSINNIPCKKLLAIVQFALCLPGTNAVTERVFSVVNKIWTSEKTQLSVETLKAMLQIRQNFTETCEEFHMKISKDEDLLKKVHSAEKYL